MRLVQNQKNFRPLDKMLEKSAEKVDTMAGCTSADPNNPYGQEPAEGNPGATTEETAAVLIYEQA